MKTETKQAHPELSAITGSLSNALINSRGSIYGMLDNGSSLVQMRAYVLECIQPLNSTPAVKRFVNALNKQHDKVHIAMLVNNTILAGDNLGVI